MGRLLIVLGILLIIVAVGLMIAIFAVEDLPLAQDILVNLYCEADETAITSASRLSFNGTQNSTTVYFCEDIEGNRREISNVIVLTAVTAFIIPFLTGLFIIMGTVGFLARRTTNKLLSLNSMNIIRSADGTLQTNLSPEQQANLQNMMKTFEASSVNVVSSSSSTLTLTERLQQLEKAHRKGLISRVEYEQTRQNILDAMDDDL
ncbi:MAG: hypothetical protein AAFV93_04625 [Chloroflexota bacterium]